MKNMKRSLKTLRASNPLKPFAHYVRFANVTGYKWRRGGDLNPRGIAPTRYPVDWKSLSSLAPYRARLPLQVFSDQGPDCAPIPEVIFNRYRFVGPIHFLREPCHHHSQRALLQEQVLPPASRVLDQVLVRGPGHPPYQEHSYLQ